MQDIKSGDTVAIEFAAKPMYGPMYSFRRVSYVTEEEVIIVGEDRFSKRTGEHHSKPGLLRIRPLTPEEKDAIDEQTAKADAISRLKDLKWSSLTSAQVNDVYNYAEALLNKKVDTI
jgi:hypothetical protein